MAKQASYGGDSDEHLPVATVSLKENQVTGDKKDEVADKSNYSVVNPLLQVKIVRELQHRP